MLSLRHASRLGLASLMVTCGLLIYSDVAGGAVITLTPSIDGTIRSSSNGTYAVTSDDQIFVDNFRIGTQVQSYTTSSMTFDLSSVPDEQIIAMATLSWTEAGDANNPIKQVRLFGSIPENATTLKYTGNLPLLYNYISNNKTDSPSFDVTTFVSTVNESGSDYIGFSMVAPTSNVLYHIYSRLASDESYRPTLIITTQSIPEANSILLLAAVTMMSLAFHFIRSLGVQEIPPSPTPPAAPCDS